MAKNPDILIENRRNEILQTFYELTETYDLQDINIKVISTKTRFTRATIYNYFKNIDEIFISAYQKEYESWAIELEDILNSHKKMTKKAFASAIAKSLENRERMLRLSTDNFHEREKNCRKEFIFSHKLAFSKVITLFHDCLKKFFPEFSEEEVIDKCYEFFPFMHGMYRYVDLTPIQKEARDYSHIILQETTIYDLSYKMVMQLLKK